MPERFGLDCVCGGSLCSEALLLSLLADMGRLLSELYVRRDGDVLFCDLLSAHPVQSLKVP